MAQAWRSTRPLDEGMQGHLFAFKKAGYETEAFIHWLTLSPGHLGASQMQKV